MDLLESLGTAGTEHAGDTSFMQHLTETRDYLQRWGCAPFLCNVGLLHSIYGTESFQPEASLRVTERSRVQEAAGDRCERLCFVNCVMERETFDAAIVRLCNSGLRGCLHGGELLSVEPEFRIVTRKGDCSDAVTWNAATGARHTCIPNSFMLSQRELMQLATMLLADWLQQVPHHEASMSVLRPRLYSHSLGGVKGNWVIHKGGWWSMRREIWASIAQMLGGQAEADYIRVFAELDAVADGACHWQPLEDGEVTSRELMRSRGAKEGSKRRLAPAGTSKL